MKLFKRYMYTNDQAKRLKCRAEEVRFECFQKGRDALMLNYAAIELLHVCRSQDYFRN